jgi:hypothetical protein
MEYSYLPPLRCPCCKDVYGPFDNLVVHCCLSALVSMFPLFPLPLGNKPRHKTHVLLFRIIHGAIRQSKRPGSAPKLEFVGSNLSKLCFRSRQRTPPQRTFVRSAAARERRESFFARFPRSFSSYVLCSSSREQDRRRQQRGRLVMV